MNRFALERVLKKRLKFFFDPLISSLGDGADNVSVFVSCIRITCAYNLCISCVRIMCTYHVCISRVYIMCAYQVCISCMHIMCAYPCVHIICGVCIYVHGMYVMVTLIQIHVNVTLGTPTR